MQPPGSFWPTNRALFRRTTAGWNRAGFWLVLVAVLLCGGLAVLYFR